VRRVVLSLACFAVLLAACGGAEKGTGSLSGDTSGSTPTAPPSTPPQASGSKPTVTVPDTPPPTTLLVEDLTVGSGAEAVAGKQVTVHYVGVSYSTKQQFDASWDRNQPFTFALGSGQVIRGWDQGVARMKVGGRRKLTIPPDLAYGPQGRPPVIAPNETLVFVIDLLGVS
jgi:peptidylprolyl isomerase